VAQYRHVFRLLRLVRCCLLLYLSVAGSLSAQSSADWDWMSSHFDKALHDLFPMDERYGGYVAYRSHRDLYTDLREYSFVIGTENSDTVSGSPRFLSAQVREAESASVYDQMMALHRRFPNRSADVGLYILSLCSLTLFAQTGEKLGLFHIFLLRLSAGICPVLHSFGCGPPLSPRHPGWLLAQKKAATIRIESPQARKTLKCPGNSTLRLSDVKCTYRKKLIG